MDKTMIKGCKNTCKEWKKQKRKKKNNNNLKRNYLNQVKIGNLN